MTRFSIRPKGGGYALFDETGRYVGACSSLGLAQERADRLMTPKTVHARACMCCGEPFASEGPFNRLCKDCTRAGGGTDPAISDAVAARLA